MNPRQFPATLPPLKDRIKPGVRALFVGINPGVRSALTGHHFAGFSNRFWKLLSESGLAPRPVTYLDDDKLPEWGFGITNLVARPTPGVQDLSPAEYEAGRAALLRKIRRYKPEVVALTGVSLARALLPNAPAAALEPGLHAETLADVPVFVLPNPSGRNAHYSYASMLEAFRGLKRYLDQHRDSRK
jgi:TDG/mug DNA glycosylase family protein